MVTKKIPSELRQFNLATLRKEAAKRGATVEHRHIGKWHSCNVDAPAGKVWACSGDIHSLVVEWQDVPGDDRNHAWRNDAIADALSRMAYGLSDCDDLNCDYCHPEQE